MTDAMGRQYEGPPAAVFSVRTIHPLAIVTIFAGHEA
jgi:hypothetical protein